MPFYDYSHSDYRRLQKTDWQSWSDKDLADFLVEDPFAVAASQSVSAEDMKNAFLRGQESLNSKYNRTRKIFKVLDKILLSLFIVTKSKGKKNILFQNAKYPAIILETKKHYHVGLITQATKDRLFALRHLMGYVAADDLYKFVCDYLKTKDVKHLHNLVKKVEEKLKKTNPDYVVLWDDGLPAGRAMALACKKLGITSLVIQQGMYDSYFSCFYDFVCDYDLLWGNYFKNLLCEKYKARKPEDTFVSGYPYPMRVEKSVNNTPKTVCYIGQDYERIDTNLLKAKLDTVPRVAEICKNLGLDFLYRPHPGDNRQMLSERMPEVKFTNPQEKLEETFAKSDVFIAFSSTALIEAAMRNKVSLQLMTYPIEFDNFEELGICSKTLKDVQELENYLSNVVSVGRLGKFRPKFNNNYIETRKSPGERFLEVMKEIETKSK
jgi:hypothetical protein